VCDCNQWHLVQVHTREHTVHAVVKASMHVRVCKMAPCTIDVSLCVCVCVCVHALTSSIRRM
jgi:hypothetical protein